jgi:hypothetical protein
LNLPVGAGLRRGVISSIIADVTRQGYRPVNMPDGPRFAACACNETGAKLLIEDSKGTRIASALAARSASGRRQ